MIETDGKPTCLLNKKRGIGSQEFFSRISKMGPVTKLAIMSIKGGIASRNQDVWWVTMRVPSATTMFHRDEWGLTCAWANWGELINRDPIKLEILAATIAKHVHSKRLAQQRGACFWVHHCKRIGAADLLLDFRLFARFCPTWMTFSDFARFFRVRLRTNMFD